MASAARLVDFYRGGRDAAGRTLAEILSWNDQALEETHDYIQWLFPLVERSGANPAAPTLTQADIEAFRSEPELRHAVLKSFRRMLAFYGFFGESIDTAKPSVRKDASFLERSLWLSRPHNFLRLTRILRSLRVLGLPEQARAFFVALTGVYDEHRARIGERTYAYWVDAVEGPDVDG